MCPDTPRLFCPDGKNKGVENCDAISSILTVKSFVQNIPNINNRHTSQGTHLQTVSRLEKSCFKQSRLKIIPIKQA